MKKPYIGEKSTTPKAEGNQFRATLFKESPANQTEQMKTETLSVQKNFTFNDTTSSVAPKMLSTQ